jgi:hypothetical protein
LALGEVKTMLANDRCLEIWLSAFSLLELYWFRD